MNTNSWISTTFILVIYSFDKFLAHISHLAISRSGWWFSRPYSRHCRGGWWLSRPYRSALTVGAAQVTSRPYSDICCRGGWWLSRPYRSALTVGAVQVTSRPYSDICRGGWAAGAEDAHCRGAPNPSRPYSKNVPVPAVRIWRSGKNTFFLLNICNMV